MDKVQIINLEQLVKQETKKEFDQVLMRLPLGEYMDSIMHSIIKDA